MKREFISLPSFDVYAKAKKDNLTKEEINELKQVVEILKA